GVAAGGLLAVLWVGGLYRSLRPWARGRATAGQAVASALLRGLLLLAGLAGLAAIGAPALVVAAVVLMVLRPVLVRILAPRLEHHGGSVDP
ncbi:MAG: hypothetical protein P8Y02_03320, partial [Deinococcales bacterium]